MRYVEAPESYIPAPGERSLFLAGGITGCPDWQAEMVTDLFHTPLVLLNPRRREFAVHDPSMSTAQIQWEFIHLRRASGVLFWFPSESICPIALYELGAWSMMNEPLFVGTHPNYPRRADVLIQTGLARPDVVVVHSLAALTQQVRSWARG